MRATLVRFGPDLFEDLKAEAERSGISVAQFVREAVVARIAYSAGKRGERGYEASRAQTVRQRSRDLLDGSMAVRAQSEQATKRSREVTSKSS